MSERAWNSEPFVRPRAEYLPASDRGLVCGCDPWPCDEQSCRRDRLSDPCPACRRHGQAFHNRAETRWLDTGEGLPPSTVDALQKLSVPHATNKLKARTRTSEREEGAA